jgi:glycosyltransferase involved in cell wall biosynthesis
VKSDMNTPDFKICIDARLWGITHTGIGRYTENLIANLPPESLSNLILICSPENYLEPKLLPYRRVLAKYHPYSVLSQFEMFIIWLKTRPRLFHATHSSIPVFWPGKIIVTFHDLIRHFSYGPDTTTRHHLFYWLKYFSYLMVDRIALWRAVKVLVPSDYWKNQIVNKFHTPESKIIVTYEGVTPEISPDTSPLKFKIKLPYVVYTGNLYPHKNIEVLLSAVRKLKGSVHLVLVGARGVFTGQAKTKIDGNGIGEWVTLLGRLTDGELSNLYSHALAFVFPSKIEGFGLTGLEAMSSGLPVIAAKASCLPEIYADAALYFNPDHPDELVAQINSLKSDSRLRRKMITLGFNRVKLYSWAKMGRQTWKIYQNV